MKLKIGRRTIGDGAPCFIIAEAGVNHNGDIERALKMVRAAKACKADAIKFQSFHAQELATRQAPLANYQRQPRKSLRSQVEMLRRLALDEDDQRELFQTCRRLQIQFLSTPFDELSARFLAELGVPAFKIGSGELTNLPFIRFLARYGRPMLISTGMGSLGEVGEAVRVARRAGNSQTVLLQCTTAYPTPIAEANLRVLPVYRKRFRSLVGFSDHTLGLTAAIAATALGACVIEKHFTLSRRLAGPDHRASLEVDELREFVARIRETDAALGDGRKRLMPSEQPNLSVARKSIVSRVDIPAGVRIEEAMLTMKRPGSGIPPRDLPRLVGKAAREHIPADTLISWGQVR
jgi:N,N'-diacetyllegionaminate synthase